jgi:hypothetical protein
MAGLEKGGVRFHAKASEKYVDVVFAYDGFPPFPTSIPLEYRRTGTSIEDSQIDQYLARTYSQVHPAKWDEWRNEQAEFWQGKPNAAITKAFFDVLAREFSWCCVSCTLPTNPNWARRTQDLKEFGYTIATDTNRHCPNCQKRTTQLILVPLPRGGITGYETWSPQLRQNIVNLLAVDAFEGRDTRKESLLPDHKFPEIRWDAETRRPSLENLTQEEIQRDFQLLSNQRNQQKREICRHCFQTGERGTFLGILFFYHGGLFWNEAIPRTGKEAELGCVGCAWYDIDRWRQEINQRLTQPAFQNAPSPKSP